MKRSSRWLQVAALSTAAGLGACATCSRQGGEPSSRTAPVADPKTSASVPLPPRADVRKLDWLVKNFGRPANEHGLYFKAALRHH